MEASPDETEVEVDSASVVVSDVMVASDEVAEDEADEVMAVVLLDQDEVVVVP